MLFDPKKLKQQLLQKQREEEGGGKAEDGGTNPTTGDPANNNNHSNKNGTVHYSCETVAEPGHTLSLVLQKVLWMVHLSEFLGIQQGVVNTPTTINPANEHSALVGLVPFI